MAIAATNIQLAVRAPDPAAVGLWRNLTAMERALSGNGGLLEHPIVNWATESDDLFRQNLPLASAALIPAQPAKVAHP